MHLEAEISGESSIKPKFELSCRMASIGSGSGEYEYNDVEAIHVDSNDLQPEVAQIINTLRGNSLRGLLLVQISLHPYPTFISLEKAVCNHGFFMMAPNKWDPTTKTLTRPLRLATHDDDDSSSSSSVIVLIRHCLQENVLQVYIDNTHHIAHPPNQTAIMEQVKRMLRISQEDEIALKEFQKVYPEAAVEGFGRLFRSPTLFEDIVKSVLLSHCGWSRSLILAQSLCELQFEGTNSLKNFPSSKELAQLDVEHLKRCNLGYRAEIVSSIIDKVQKKHLQLDMAGHHHHPIDELMKISGIGTFTAANISMCMGFYDMVPIDTETFRHLRKVHGMKNPDQKTVKDMYQKYAPYDALAYWFEHHRLYECEFGKLSELSPSNYHLVTSNRADRDKSDYKIRVAKSKKIVKKKKKKGRRDKKSFKLLSTM